MTVISMDFNDLKTLIGKDIEKGEFFSKIQLIGGDVERIDGDQIDVEFFPDRPDLFCVEGVARAIRAYLGFEKGLKRYEIGKSDVVIKVEKSVKNVRPYIVCGLVRNIEMSDYLVKSLMDLQEKLHFSLGRKRKKASIGVHDFNNVKPPFTYIGVEPKSIRFVPLAKTQEMDLKEILQYHEKGIEYAHLLKDKEKYPIIIDANSEVLSFPPIINGTLTTVTEKTENIFIDVTGLDYNAINYCLNIVSTALAERNGKIESCKIIYDDKVIITPNLKPRKREVEQSYVNKLIGTNLSIEEIINFLEKMGFGARANEKNLKVSIPAYRTDIMHEIDLVEEIAIGYGIDRLEGILPKEMTFGKSRALENLCSNLRNLVIGLGFNEVMTLTLSSKNDQFDKMGIKEKMCVILKNPISMDYNILRVSLIPSLLNILKANKHRELPQKIFEIGDVVINAKNVRKLGALVIHSKASFTESKSIAEAILREFNTDYKIKPKKHESFIDGRCAGIDLNGKEIGYFGELHPKVITAFELSHPIIAIEMKIENIK